MPWDLLFVFVIVLIGGFIQGTSGFGFGLVAMGFLPVMLSIKESTLLVIALALVASLSILVKIYKHIELKGLYLIVGSALLGRILSFFVLTSYGEMEILKQLLGFFLIGMVLYLFFQKKKSSSSFVVKPVIPIVLGLMGGFIRGVFAVGGPFFVFYLIND
ncbi:sulfite exporter TauE/SafE family protein [Halalkalibacter lacteus]|uniref:sulfite exporter TauE/SafE family protein n=1 Tax=Halalkalibacter lacteus TaxID=3090663 RepID=UPI002FC8C1D1